MIYLPSTTERATDHLRHAARIAGATALALGAGTVGLDATGTAEGAQAGLYTATAIATLGAVALKSGEAVRRMIGTASTAMLAELAEQRETLRQLVGEVARLRDAQRTHTDELCTLVNDTRWQGYVSCLSDMQDGRVNVLRPGR